MAIVRTTAAFNVDIMRQRMMERVALPADMVQRAMEITRAKLEAKTTKFFSHRGEVIDQVDVEDHATQLHAAEQVYSLAGLYARERDARPVTPTVVMEVDTVTGVIRMVVGAQAQMENAYEVTPTQTEAHGAGHGHGNGELVSLRDVPEMEEAPTIHKIKRDTEAAALRALFSDNG